MKGGRNLFSLNYIFASFFGAALIAAAFAYFNYRFSEYKFIDFNQWTFYEKSDIFVPKHDKYIVVVYSSNMQNIDKILTKINKTYPIIAVDLYQHRRGQSHEVSYITSGMNSLLKFIQRFNIYEVPSLFLIKKSHGSLYKQDSQIEIIK
ncbi:hypothetical protein [Sulfurospirillum sp. 1612]|uniref:hypothetical protein n=1 Tax=Sulfurospirillum sp. 1612 TaxID=3094835 RepID=UPI002F945A30